MKTSENLLTRGQSLVAAIHSITALRAAISGPIDNADFLELRVDRLLEYPEEVETFLTLGRQPVILTVRDRSEGGSGNLSALAREKLFDRYIRYATLVDIEVRAAEDLHRVLQNSRERGVGVILSFHDFEKTPSIDLMREVVTQAEQAGADVVKIATRIAGPRDLAELLPLAELSRTPLSLMGMGPYGKISRLMFAAFGSVLNYGCIDVPEVEGQWDLAAFERVLAKLGIARKRDILQFAQPTMKKFAKEALRA